MITMSNKINDFDIDGMVFRTYNGGDWYVFLYDINEHDYLCSCLTSGKKDYVTSRYSVSSIEEQFQQNKWQVLFNIKDVAHETKGDM